MTAIKMTVIKNEAGEIINIGEWDECADGGVILNPIPVGAYKDEAMVVQGLDGGLYEESDPRLNSSCA